jgi:hypothetical protein
MEVLAMEQSVCDNQVVSAAQLKEALAILINLSYSIPSQALWPVFINTTNSCIHIA